MSFSLPHQAFLDPAVLDKIKAFIIGRWEETVRFNQADEGTLLGLPFPYTIPSRNDVFQEFYYWDTYFTSIGLLLSEREDLALSNTKNLLALAERYGFVPNGNRTYYLHRSQPPYIAALVNAVADTLKDSGLRQAALPTLRREYAFWTTRRMTPTGLSRYGHDADDKEVFEFAAAVASRIGIEAVSPSDLAIYSHKYAECESGWDFNPRFEHRCEDFCPVDLNSLLYLYERFLAEHGDPGERAHAARQAEDRKARMCELCWDSTRGGFFDYDFKNGRRSPIVSVAALQPLWAGIATQEQAALTLEKVVPQLEFAFGIAACAPSSDSRVCQWNYPNGWPCLHHIAYVGLHRYGHTEAALRIAGKYLATIARVFEETGDLWEKYNVEDGSTRTLNETGYITDDPRIKDPSAVPDTAPAMMGWTAGVFLDALKFYRTHRSP